jgi:GxxExxY protein
MSLDPKNPVNEITERVIGAAISVHRELGPGLLESAYQACLEYELVARHVQFRREQKVPLIYKGRNIEYGYRLDLVVEDKVIVEVKSIEVIAGIHIAQLVTYLRLTNLPVGLLLNFNVTSLRKGLRRITLRDREPIVLVDPDECRRP